MDFDALMIDDTAFESADGYDDFNYDDEVPEEDTSMDAATEAAYFLASLSSECESLEEYQSIVLEGAIDWEAQGLIPDAAAVMEAVKKITINDWKSANFERLWHRECIRLGKKNKNPHYAKYRKYRDLLLPERAALYKQYESKAKANVKAAMRNSKHKSANIHTKTGKAVHTKVSSAFKKAEAGQNTSGVNHVTNIKPKGVK